MAWFKHKKEKPEQPEDKYQRVVAFYLEIIEAKPESLRELISEGQELLALENHSHHVGDFAQVAIMQWRHGDDPRPIIE